uniref:NADH dehydrogenase [ubiquinone] flavoprotein 3, mitochondrial n=1 Tax=Electrophorus electricus TaxID=8005 RepID=A0A4W4FI93_ELEEL
MATSLFRLGRLGSLKCLQQGSWGTLRMPFTAAFCIKAEDKKKPAKKTKAAKPVPPPEPESFDNTTYKNLQHHSYHMFTFSDMDVELAKHRLPQPSTGRPSPMH